MLARDLISDLIPPLKTSDNGVKALSWMDEFRVTHLPIVNNTDFLGLISEEDILNLNTPDQPIGNHTLSLMRPFVLAEQHIYEVIKMIANLKLTLVPVLDKEQHYLGIILLTDLVQKMADIGAIRNPGGIVVLEINIRDYSLTEISQIVEGAGASILSSYVTSHDDSTKMELTLKLNRTDLSRVLPAFARYNYTVKASYHEDEFSEDLKNRYDSLMNYLNI